MEQENKKKRTKTEEDLAHLTELGKKALEKKDQPEEPTPEIKTEVKLGKAFQKPDETQTEQLSDETTEESAEKEIKLGKALQQEDEPKKDETEDQKPKEVKSEIKLGKAFRR